MNNNYRDTVAIVDLRRLKHNVQTIYKTSQKPLMAIIKANAYGHGAKHVAKVLEDLDEVAMYGLATLNEALDLRKENIKKGMLVIGPTHYTDALIASKWDITLTGYSLDYIKQIQNLKFEKPLKLHIKLDTGMNRIGLKTREELDEAMALLKENEMIEVTGVFTHFGGAETNDGTYQKQLDTFIERIQGYSFKYIHCDNTAGTMYHHDDITNMDRLGIGMYGIDPKGIINPDLQPVMSLFTRVMMVKEIKAKEKVGYNFTYEASQDERIATLPIGYADGLIRKNQGRKVWINDHFYPIVGRVCMDQIMVACDQKVKVHDLVEIFGDHISIVDMANELETIPYEILCLLSPRVERAYLK